MLLKHGLYGPRSSSIQFETPQLTIYQHLPSLTDDQYYKRLNCTTSFPNTPPESPSARTISTSSSIDLDHDISSPASNVTMTSSPNSKSMTPVVITKPINYPPYEMTDRHPSLTSSEWNQLGSLWNYYNVRQYTHVNGLIGVTGYSVPYNGKKSPTLEEVTNKNTFDFFAYTFTIPQIKDSPAKDWHIMWDYETGMVRMYSIFRCLGHSKTVPRTALKTNPLLEKLAVSPTGGRVDFQGFWIPYDCAFELCTKFCHELRAVLYPMFGPGILRECLNPSDEGFKNWIISPDVIERCWAAVPSSYRSPPPPSSRDESPAVPIKSNATSSGRGKVRRVADQTTFNTNRTKDVDEMDVDDNGDGDAEMRSIYEPDYDYIYQKYPGSSYNTRTNDQRNTLSNTPLINDYPTANASFRPINQSDLELNRLDNPRARTSPITPESLASSTASPNPSRFNTTRPLRADPKPFTPRRVGKESTPTPRGGGGYILPTPSPYIRTQYSSERRSSRYLRSATRQTQRFTDEDEEEERERLRRKFDRRELAAIEGLLMLSEVGTAKGWDAI